MAEKLREHYPEGHLLVELHGATKPVAPEQALQTVIRAFEREASLPDDLGQLQALYNQVLAGKRVLILADDAKDAAQVRPLLPPPGCALLVTTRNCFHLPGMRPFDLDTLDAPDAEKLLREVCERIGEHAGRLAKFCGYLPLALRVSAGVLANSSRSVEGYLEQLEAERLKHLRDPDSPDDPQASVEASLRLSYEALEPAAQAALCQLSVFVTSFDRDAALAVVEVEGDREELLDRLLRRSLLEWDAASERYNLHDLVREFGAARLEDVDAVWLRYTRHYGRVADQARQLYHKGGAAMLAGLRTVRPGAPAHRRGLGVGDGPRWRAGCRRPSEPLRECDGTHRRSSLRRPARAYPAA